MSQSFGLLSSTDELGCMVVRNLLIKLIRRNHPKARIALLAEEKYIDAARAFHQQVSWVDECVSIETERVQSASQRVRLQRVLEDQELDTIILSPGSSLPYQIPFLCGIPRRVGLGLGRDPDQLRFLSHVVQLSQEYHEDTHWSILIQGYAEALGYEFKAASDYVPFLRVEKPVDRPLAVASKRVAVHVGGNPEWNRRWPLRRFLRLCRSLASDGQVCVSLLGSRSESYENQLIVAQVKRDFAHAAIRDVSGGSYSDTAEEISAADLFVGNDSGPMNMALALGTPIVAIRGADAENFRPDAVDGKHIVFSGWANCSRRRSGSNDCELGCPIAYDRDTQEYPKCMETISFKSVRQAVAQQLTTAPALGSATS